jgi:hypothetical protein
MKRHAKPSQMNFDDFLSVLVKLSVKVFRTSGVETKDEAFEKLLGEKILPFASRRTPDHVSSFMANAEIMGLFAEYDDAFTLIFGHYASGNETTSQSVNDMEDKGVRVAGSRDPASASYKPMNSMKEAMTYAGAWQRAPWALRPLLHSPHPHLPPLNPAALSLSLSLSLSFSRISALCQLL